MSQAKLGPAGCAGTASEGCQLGPAGCRMPKHKPKIGIGGLALEPDEDGQRKIMIVLMDENGNWQLAVVRWDEER